MYGIEYCSKKENYKMYNKMIKKYIVNIKL